MLIVRFILLSLIVHFLVMFAMTFIPNDLSSRHQDVTEIDIISPPSKNPHTPDRQVVRNPLTPDKLTAPEDDSLARFLSEQRHRTRKETQASQNGLTKNRAGGAPNKAEQTQAQTQSRPNKNSLPTQGRSDRDLEAEGFRDWNPGRDLRQMNRAASGGPSTIGDRLPTDVSVGSFTSLNTDQYTYYTFYARIEELIRFRWESRVQNSINSFDRSTVLNVIGRKTWITNVEFLLSPDGRLQKSMIMKESGVPKFDMAAINAFKEAAMFPNPPQELVEEDGFIHLKYAFAVYFNPSAMAEH